MCVDCMYVYNDLVMLYLFSLLFKLHYLQVVFEVVVKCSILLFFCFFVHTHVYTLSIGLIIYIPRMEIDMSISIKP